METKGSLIVSAWAIGFVMMVNAFKSRQNSQAFLFCIIFSIACFVVAIILTCVRVNAPKRKAEEERKKELEIQTKREQRETQLAHMEGLAKFHQMDVDDAREYQEAIDVMRKVGNIVEKSVYQEKETDWAIMGGIAAGIAGPAAGIVTATKIIQDNERINAENAARREWGAKQNTFYQDLASQAKQKSPTALSMSALQKKYEAILSWAPSTLFSLIKLRDTKIDVDAQTGAVTVSTSWHQDDKSICIDGSLRAKIYTNSGECARCSGVLLF